jgi:exodeoxyribonuclease III
MKIIAWNINGMRAIITKKDLYNLIEEANPDIICFGETKLTCPIISVKNTLEEKITGYKYRYFSQCSIKKGYSGTAIFSKKKPLNIYYGIEQHDVEGRVITLEYNNFYLIHVYTPNSGEILARLKYRINTWDVEFKKYLEKLQKKKPIIVCGDLNVANDTLDLHNPSTNAKNAGFTIEERNSFKKLLNELHLIDTFRYLNPTKIEYSYWSYRFQARNKNKGWRIDYFLTSQNIIKYVKQSKILTNILGSDHAPIELNIKKWVSSTKNQ